MKKEIVNNINLRETSIKSLDRKIYAIKMKEAARDKNFIKRTMTCQKRFDSIID